MGRMIALALLFTAVPRMAQADVPLISIKTIDVFQASLRQMGYDPEVSKSDDGHPVFKITRDGSSTAIVLGGCENGTACTYVAFVTSLTDVINPPAEWLQSVNDDFDLIKVVVNDDKTLRIAHSAVIEGLPVTSFRYLLDQWFAGVSEVGQKAIKDKLVLVAPGKPR